MHKGYHELFPLEECDPVHFFGDPDWQPGMVCGECHAKYVAELEKQNREMRRLLRAKEGSEE